MSHYNGPIVNPVDGRLMIWTYDPNGLYTRQICARVHHLFRTGRENAGNRILTLFNICRKYRCLVAHLQGACSHLLCLFSHDSRDTTLLMIPDYLCAVHLYNQMKIELPFDGFTCRGLHVDLMELDDLEFLKRKHAKYIGIHLSQKKLTEQCEVCHKRVHRFGNWGFRQLAMLFCCEHKFCLSCLNEEHECCKISVCPICKNTSKFIYNPWNPELRDADHLHNDYFWGLPPAQS